MSEDICNVVSNVFYNGNLRVAADKKQDSIWRQERVLQSINGYGAHPAVCKLVRKDGTWSKKYHGPIRYDSAEAIQYLIPELLKTLSPSDILILTPFRAQRTLIRIFLKNAKIKNISVNTVHRSQGSERHTVIFDPVLASNAFLTESQNPDARRLVNVALSRAKARLILFVSYGDFVNPLFNQLKVIIEGLYINNDYKDIIHFINDENFPHNLLHHSIVHGRRRGKVTEILSNGEGFVILDDLTGQAATFKTQNVLTILKRT